MRYYRQAQKRHNHKRLKALRHTERIHAFAHLFVFFRRSFRCFTRHKSAYRQGHFGHDFSVFNRNYTAAELTYTVCGKRHIIGICAYHNKIVRIMRHGRCYGTLLKSDTLYKSISYMTRVVMSFNNGYFQYIMLDIYAVIAVEINVRYQIIGQKLPVHKGNNMAFSFTVIIDIKIRRR